MPDCPRCSSGLEETAEHAFYYCERVCPFWDHVGEWTARIEPKKLVLLDVGYVVDNVLPPFHCEKRVVFFAILAVARMVIRTTRNKGLYDDANFSHRDLVLYFRHQLRVKIRCDRKRLDRITFSKRWVNAASLVVRKGAMLESSFPPLPAHGVYGTGPFSLFSFVYIFFGFFSPIPIISIVNKLYIVNKIMHHFRVLSRSSS